MSSLCWLHQKLHYVLLCLIMCDNTVLLWLLQHFCLSSVLCRQKLFFKGNCYISQDGACDRNDNQIYVCLCACRLRIMMKMHGLGDSAYWIIQYSWFLFIYCCYILILLIVGSAINLKFFRLTNYGLQIIFFFVWGNCLIAFAFLASVFFTNAKTANVVAFLWVFGTGLLNNLLMENYYKDHHSWVYVVELIPSFALYRALYEQVRAQHVLKSACQFDQLIVTTQSGLWSSMHCMCIDDEKGVVACDDLEAYRLEFMFVES